MVSRVAMRTSAAAPGPRTAAADAPRTARPTAAAPQSRRVALGVVGGAALALFPSRKPAMAGQFTGKKQWDGVVRGNTCELGEEGDECRQKQFGKDADNLKESVMNKSSNGNYKAQTGQAASKIDDEYFKTSEALISEINAYLDLDVFDKQRRVATTDIQTDAKTWTGRYAPGGSARLQSAQRLYVVVDSLLGHFAQNGFAPLPEPMKNKARSDMVTASGLLAKGL